MLIDATKLTNKDSHNILRKLVMPRPISLVSNVNLDGQLNIAPLSCHNVVSVLPLMIGIAIGRWRCKEKDSILGTHDN